MWGNNVNAWLRIFIVHPCLSNPCSWEPCYSWPVLVYILHIQTNSQLLATSALQQWFIILAAETSHKSSWATINSTSTSAGHEQEMMMRLSRATWAVRKLTRTMRAYQRWRAAESQPPVSVTSAYIHILPLCCATVPANLQQAYRCLIALYYIIECRAANFTPGWTKTSKAHLSLHSSAICRIVGCGYNILLALEQTPSFCSYIVIIIELCQKVSSGSPPSTCIPWMH